MASVKLLLNESIKNVGRVGDIVDVSSGYARNYLIPQGLAVQPTPNNVKKVEERRKEIERVEKDKRDQQAKIIEKLAGVEVQIERRANEQGHLFGSVSATDIAKGLQAQNFNVEPDDVLLPGKLDQVNNYTVKVQFAEDLAQEIKVWVVPDSESKAAIIAYARNRKTEEAAEEKAEKAE